MKARDIKRPNREPAAADQDKPPFDPTKTDQLDDDSQVSLASTIEGGSSGKIDYDDRGQARWKWKTESTPAGNAERTFDLLKALNTDTLSIEDDGTDGDAPPEQPPRQSGYNPYDVGGGGATKRKPGK